MYVNALSNVIITRYYGGMSLVRTLGQKKVLVRCPDFRDCNCTKRVFRTVKCVLLIEVRVS